MAMTEEALLEGDHADTLILAFQFTEMHWNKFMLFTSYWAGDVLL